VTGAAPRGVMPLWDTTSGGGLDLCCADVKLENSYAKIVPNLAVHGPLSARAQLCETGYPAGECAGRRGNMATSPHPRDRQLHFLLLSIETPCFGYC
jgi:hypothetical protein